MSFVVHESTIYMALQLTWKRSLLKEQCHFYCVEMESSRETAPEWQGCWLASFWTCNSGFDLNSFLMAYTRTQQQTSEHFTPRMRDLGVAVLCSVAAHILKNDAWSVTSTPCLWHTEDMVCNHECIWEALTSSLWILMMSESDDTLPTFSLFELWNFYSCKTIAEIFLKTNCNWKTGLFSSHCPH